MRRAGIPPAARARTETPPALKFDEFGDELPTSVAARLDNFASGPQERPAARGFIIVHAPVPTPNAFPKGRR